MLPPLNRRPSFEARILRQDGCWQWLASFNKKGYGVFVWGTQKRTGAHRASWLYFNGSIPAGMQVLHRCDNPGCVNPDHLFLGDNDANVADKVAKGRCAAMAGPQNPMWGNYRAAARGEQVHSAIFSEADVLRIRRRWAAGESQSALARRYGTFQGVIWGIVRGKTWSHLPLCKRPGDTGLRRLTEGEREGILTLREVGATIQTLAIVYGVSESSIKKTILRAQLKDVCILPA